ncbi:SdrD B-like domain-containing protein [Limnoglobus roseus]|uniref:SD-repeat containing protein B domain-containing protein n=1 Tax=Limnoglobus roseus TaxID=2598579 RepID=A0A5C1A8M9_9BACT|nr:SdrD B-like domain-containing protein [Limnoglobus roseus]QEL14122.1 hypothetical protein PX52LOC_00988 [Limnoglobus roseus]
MTRVKLSQWALEELTDRIVPAAVLDLTAKGAEAMAAGAIVRQVDAQPTGTGYIRSFVRVQGAASSGGSEQGYNTTARPLQFDENSSPQFTRGLLLSQVPRVVEGGVAYREFLLDINQKSSASKLSLDEVRVFVGATDNLSGYNAAAKTLAGMGSVFDLDAGGDVSVKLDARLNNGSGSGDMVLLVPESKFAGSSPDGFVYLYSKMGGLSGASANGGFEEWAVRSSGGTTTPAGGTASLAGSVWIDRNQDGVRDAEDNALAGVTVTLQGVDDLGQTVVLTTTTGADGSYSFANLRAGTYSLFETQPPVPDGGTLLDGTDYVGNLGGILFESDGIVSIVLTDGAAGVGYDFTEFDHFGGGYN